MADVITRFKLETTQFDSKLRDESRRLTDLTKHLQLAGNDFNKFAANSVESARALGQLSTGTDNAAQSLKVLVKAYNDVANAYNALTEEQKKGDFGKAMAESLQQLQGRITQTKNELNSTGGVLSQLADKFVVNIDAMKLFNVGLAAVKGALNVAKDAFFASEQNLDEWGRIVDSSESLYRGFLNALNTGDISGYLTNIGNIVQAARDAYNALDELNTFNAFNQVNVEKTRTGMTEAIVDYREGNGSKESVRAAGDAYKKELEKRRKLEKEAYLTAVRKIATERGINYQDLLDAMSGSYGNYTELKKVQPSGTRLESTFLGPGMAPSITQVPVAVTRREKLGEALRNLNDTELQSLQALGAQAERTGNEIAQVDRQLVRVLNGRQGGAGGGTGGSGGGSKEITIQQQIAALEREALTATAKRQNEIRATIHLLDQELARQNEIVASLHNTSDPVSDFWKAVNRGDPNASFGIPISTKVPEGIVKPGDLKKWEDYYAAIEKPLSPLREMEAEAARLKEAMEDAASPEQYQQLNAELSAVVEKMNKFKGETVVKAGEDATESWRAAASAIQSVGSALGSIQDPAAKVMSIIAQAIATIALSYAQASSMAAKNPANAGWGWVAFAATGAATMISSIAAIKSATAGSYAEGGIVPGRSFSGDNLTANVNSGEVILSVAQANTIASILQGGGSQQSGGGTPYVTGEQIYMGLSNYLRRTGRGELITAR